MFPLIATLLVLIPVSALFDIEAGLLLGLIVALVSSQWINGGRFKQLEGRIDRLEARLTETSASAAAQAAEPPPAAAAQARREPLAESEAPAAQSPAAAPAAVSRKVTAAPPGDSQPARDPGPIDRLEALLRLAGSRVVAYFTDGNIFVRVGILILFFGVAFLLKYAAENSRIPLEIRFMGAAFGGLLLLGFGWRLRSKKPVYALLLQGGGIGVIYITIFAAFRLADLLPSPLTFGLLVFFSAFTVALAILQDSKALAIFAVLGGFAAPFLASTGSGNYIGLFSYYAVLNAAVFAVAWYRAWRPLNLLGFLFTFGVFVLWTAFDYGPEDLYPGLGFLMLFFLLYSLIGVLYAMRQPQHLAGLVDGTLVFGTPVIVSGLMMFMLRDRDYGIAMASAGMGLYYLLLARFAWRRIGAEFRLLAEALLAIGVVFATLAIPYALEGHWSSAAWALEAAGILWVSIRQQRFYAQCFAILLQLGSGVLFLLRNVGEVGATAWLNPAFLGGLFIALGALVSARMLYLQVRDFRLRPLHIPFYVWGMGWWLVSALVQIDEYYRVNDVIALLILFTVTAAALVYLDRQRRWDWIPASINAALLLPALILVALYSALESGHVLRSPDIYFWAAALAANYWMITRLESVAWPAWVNLAAHTLVVLFVSILLSAELVWLFDNRFAIEGDGYRALLAAVPLLAMRAAQLRWFPAIARLGDGLQLSLLGVLAAFLGLCGLLLNLTNSGNADPLPYLPFLNPVDLVQIAFFVLLIDSLKYLPASLGIQREHILVLLGALIFVWLTAVLIRSMHHFLDIRFDMSSMLRDSRVQTAISILWTLIGMGGMLFASRRSIRILWIVGAALIGVVLVKMLFIDLDASGTVERIVSFLVVGALLVATGYFSPIPPRRDPDDPGAGQASRV
jgi:uncharacterized membrane protein